MRGTFTHLYNGRNACRIVVPSAEPRQFSRA
jgi:hypothetical protein